MKKCCLLHTEQGPQTLLMMLSDWREHGARAAAWACVRVSVCVCGSIMFTDGQIVTSFGHIWHYSDAVQCLDCRGSWLLETVCCYQLIIVSWWGAIITKSTLATVSTLLCSVWPQYSIQQVTATNTNGICVCVGYIMQCSHVVRFQQRVPGCGEWWADVAHLCLHCINQGTLEHFKIFIIVFFLPILDTYFAY